MTTSVQIVHQKIYRKSTRSKKIESNQTPVQQCLILQTINVLGTCLQIYYFQNVCMQPL